MLYHCKLNDQLNEGLWPMLDYQLAPSNSGMFCYGFDTQGEIAVCADASSSGGVLAFADSGGVVYPWTKDDPSGVSVNLSSQEVYFIYRLEFMPYVRRKKSRVYMASLTQPNVFLIYHSWTLRN